MKPIVGPSIATTAMATQPPMPCSCSGCFWCILAPQTAGWQARLEPAVQHGGVGCVRFGRVYCLDCRAVPRQFDDGKETGSTDGIAIDSIEDVEEACAENEPVSVTLMVEFSATEPNCPFGQGQPR